MRRVRVVSAHLVRCASDAKTMAATGAPDLDTQQPEEEPWRDHDPSIDAPLGALEGASPRLRCWTVSQLGTASQDGVAPHQFPAPLPDTHPAVEQFRTYGYCAISDAVHPRALARMVAAYKAKQPHARAVFEASISADTAAGEEHRASRTYRQMFDLPREDMGAVPLAEAWNSGAWGGYLVTKDPRDFSAYMDIHANPQVLPLLLALLGPALHVCEAGARTVRAPPPREHLEHGGYTEWHRDTGPGKMLPIGSAGGDYNRVKCFVMLKDVEEDGGPLGLVPGSHLWKAAGPGVQYKGKNMVKVPGHVKVAVPAGAMLLFDMRCWQ